jgi:hypothetical protein
VCPSGLTRDGAFRVSAKTAGFSPNRLYYPSYFDQYRALHGWTEVPTYAASHGCVRIPYWNAQWVYGLADHGTPSWSTTESGSWGARDPRPRTPPAAEESPTPPRGGQRP